MDIWGKRSFSEAFPSPDEPNPTFDTVTAETVTATVAFVGGSGTFTSVVSSGNGSFVDVFASGFVQTPQLQATGPLVIQTPVGTGGVSISGNDAGDVSLEVSGNTNVGGALLVGGSAGFLQSINVVGSTVTNNGSCATSWSAGSLDVSGNTNVGGALLVGGAAGFLQSINVVGSTVTNNGSCATSWTAGSVVTPVLTSAGNLVVSTPAGALALSSAGSVDVTCTGLSVNATNPSGAVQIVSGGGVQLNTGPGFAVTNNGRPLCAMLETLVANIALSGTPQPVNSGTYTYNANTLQVGSVFKMRLMGSISTLVGTAFLGFQLQTTSLVTIDTWQTPALGVGTFQFDLEWDVMVTTTGAGGSMQVSKSLKFLQFVAANSGPLVGQVFNTTVPLDTTVFNQFRWLVNFGGDPSMSSVIQWVELQGFGV